MSSDITFITNESGKTLRDRFATLLGTDTRQFDCLVGYFFISGFYKIYPSLEKVATIPSHTESFQHRLGALQL